MSACLGCRYCIPASNGCSHWVFPHIIKKDIALKKLGVPVRDEKGNVTIECDGYNSDDPASEEPTDDQIPDLTEEIETTEDWLWDNQELAALEKEKEEDAFWEQAGL